MDLGQHLGYGFFSGNFGFSIPRDDFGEIRPLYGPDR